MRLLLFLICLGILGADVNKSTPNEITKNTPKKEPNTSKILDCNAIFNARKDEITNQLNALNEKMQNLEVYKNATQNLIKQKEADLENKFKELESKLKEQKAQIDKEKQAIENEKKEIENLIAKNEQILADIKDTSNSKVSKTFAGMKENRAAPIIEELDNAKAAEILSSLTSSEMAKIMSKMDPKRAAELTLIISKGPPFDKTENQTNNKTEAKQDSTNENKEAEAKLDSKQLDFQDQGGI